MYGWETIMCHRLKIYSIIIAQWIFMTMLSLAFSEYHCICDGYKLSDENERLLYYFSMANWFILFCIASLKIIEFPIAFHTINPKTLLAMNSIMWRVKICWRKCALHCHNYDEVFFCGKFKLLSQADLCMYVNWDISRI